MTFIFLIGGGLVVLLLMIGAVISLAGERTLVEERLGPYLKEKKPEKIDNRSVLGEWVNKKVEKSSWGSRISRDLARADIKLKPAEYISIMVIVGIAGGFLSWYFGGKNLPSALLGTLVGVMLPRVYVRRQQGKRLVRFNEQLPDMLNLMVNGLRAGYSTMQAMEAVSKELPPPISEEFRRVVQEMQLGISMERALENLQRRIPSDDLDLTITAMNVQREVGGNLAEILDTISYTIRERVRIKGEIRVLTAQVSYSGRFLSAMPVLIGLALWFINRPYMMLFFQKETRLFGITALSIGAMMIFAGYMVMNKISDIEI